ncbi:MAG: WG repeat-containing protein, partial [Flavobacteriaceae bacterium]|nr:WG repeat-containing protein [Flavobacteriaceae bacterium]
MLLWASLSFAQNTKKYDRIYPYSEGLATVVLNYKEGYIDKTGKEVIP